ncbi:MAG: transposase, partial [Pirellulaceae bacterium]
MRSSLASRSCTVQTVWWRGHQYLTLVYQIDQGMKRLLWVAKDRTEQSLAGFFEILGKP